MCIVQKDFGNIKYLMIQSKKWGKREAGSIKKYNKHNVDDY